jgi:hypothetical protein
MKAMRGRIALQKHCVRNLKRRLLYFVPQKRFLCGAHASSRRFSSYGEYREPCAHIEHGLVILGLQVTLFCIISCATISHHEFPEPSSGWQTKSGQVMYRAPNTTLIGEVLVRFSKTRDFELTVSKGPGITLLSLRQDATFAEVKGGLARQGWSGPVEQAPPQLRGWLALRDQFLHAPDRKTLRYASGNETFLFRF